MSFCFFIFIFSNIKPIFGGTVKDLYQSIPAKVFNWKVKTKDQIFDRETIFKHINGGAELYLAYDFKQVFVRKYLGPDDNEIAMDIYDMGSSTEAYGVFTSEREESDADIGQGSEYCDGLLRFWKDRFFVTILAVGDDKAAEKTILELGKKVAEAIKSTGLRPDNLLNRIPEQGLDKKRVRFFHTDMLLNKHYYVSHDNILNLNRQTDCILAEYREKNQESTFLVLIRYQTNTLAQKAYNTFIKAYMPEARDSGITQTENKKWVLAKPKRDMIVLIFDAPTKKNASKLLSTIKF